MVISRHQVLFPIYIPRVYRLLTNWPEYLLNYTLRRSKPAEYHFRDGYRLLDGSGTLAGTIAVVFVRREYGSLPGLQTIVDVGANMGSFAVYAAASNPGARILCYEPHPENFRLLNDNISRNGLQHRVTAFPYAVASTKESRDFGVGQSPTHSLVGSESGRSESVACTTLQDIFSTQRLEKIDLLKINCEGAEYEILESCSSADFTHISRIRLEYHDLKGSARNGRSMSRFLESNGYAIERFTKYVERSGLFTQSGFIWARRTTI
jgi:FkbM family methyltransferase